jgi:hypothetical protein
MNSSEWHGRHALERSASGRPTPNANGGPCLLWRLFPCTHLVTCPAACKSGILCRLPEVGGKSDLRRQCIHVDAVLKAFRMRYRTSAGDVWSKSYRPRHVSLHRARLSASVPHFARSGVQAHVVSASRTSWAVDHPPELPRIARSSGMCACACDEFCQIRRFYAMAFPLKAVSSHAFSHLSSFHINVVCKSQTKQLQARGVRSARNAVWHPTWPFCEPCITSVSNPGGSM